MSYPLLTAKHGTGRRAGRDVNVRRRVLRPSSGAVYKALNATALGEMRLLKIIARGAACGVGLLALSFVFGAYIAYSRYGLAGLHRLIEIGPGDIEFLKTVAPIEFAFGFALVPFFYACKWIDERVRIWLLRQKR